MHADEVIFTMGQPTYMYAGYYNCSSPGWDGYDKGCTGCSYTEEEAGFAARVGRFWTNAAASGDPARRGPAPPPPADVWPRFAATGGGGRTVVLHPVAAGAAFPAEVPEYCTFWDRVASAVGGPRPAPRRALRRRRAARAARRGARR